MTFLRWTLLLLFAIIGPMRAGAAPADGALNVRDFGARGDGQTDDSAAFQRALDAAAKSGERALRVPSGNYLFRGSLRVPVGVTVRGSWESVPAHNGLRDSGLPKPTEGGTTFLVTGGAGDEAGAPFLTLQTNATLRGVVIYYPDQKRDAIPTPYPYAIAMRGKNPALLDVELLNPYNGVDTTGSERHLIRNVQGQPLRRGILVDEIYDVGRIENVHFNPWWSMEKTLFDWQMANGEAFIFGRTDWQYVLNTFCFGYRAGYRFIETPKGVPNGNFVGIGADNCHRAVEVQNCAIFGVLISNGEFVSFSGPDPTMVEVGATNSGTVRFSNCAFWGPADQIARIAGSGTVGFGDCTFVQWDGKNAGRAAIEASGGTLLVRGCEFREDKAQILLGPGVRRAVISGNVFQGAARIENQSRGAVKIGDNAAD